MAELEAAVAHKPTPPYPRHNLQGAGSVSAEEWEFRDREGRTFWAIRGSSVLLGAVGFAEQCREWLASPTTS